MYVEWLGKKVCRTSGSGSSSFMSVCRSIGSILRHFGPSRSAVFSSPPPFMSTQTSSPQGLQPLHTRSNKPVLCNLQFCSVAVVSHAVPAEHFSSARIASTVGLVPLATHTLHTHNSLNATVDASNTHSLCQGAQDRLQTHRTLSASWCTKGACVL